VRVLIVEDQPKTASFIRKALVAEGFAVDVAEDGETALALATTTAFDAIVLDIMLPGRDGLSVLRVLRERRVTTPVLLLSAREKSANGWMASTRAPTIISQNRLCWRNSSRACAPWVAAAAKFGLCCSRWQTSRSTPSRVRPGVGGNHRALNT